MKHFVILTSLLTLFGCKTSAQKVQVSAVFAETKRVTSENPETGKTHSFTTRVEETERYKPEISMIDISAKILKFRLQGNIGSGGHSINRVSKIRYEKGEQKGNSITLRYFVEIKNIPGKEGAHVLGYNYTKDETYKIPNEVQFVKVELFEDRINKTSDTKSKLIAQQTFNVFKENKPMKQYEKFRREILKVEELDENLDEDLGFYGSNSEDDIRKIEDALQLKFDDFHKAYLLEFGGGGVPDFFHTNGILPQDPFSDNIYTIYGATTHAREAYDLADNFLVINSDFPSDLMVIEASSGKIYNYQISTKSLSAVLYSNFESYLSVLWKDFMDDYLLDN